MRLWTIQPVEVVNILERDGVFTCNPEKSEYYNDFHDAYLWIAAEMDKRNIQHPDGLKLPLWAWHTRDWKHKKPDLRTTGLGTPEKNTPVLNLRSMIKTFFYQITAAGIMF